MNILENNKELSKRQLLDNKMAYDDDSKVLVNALDLIQLIVSQERLEVELKKTREALGLAQVMLQERRNTNEYPTINLRV